MTSSAAPLVWVLADDRPGNAAQCRGVAEALGLPFVVKDIRYDAPGALPNLLRGRSLLGLRPASRAALEPPWPDLVIAAGRRTAPVARWIKSRSDAFTVQIMNPGWPGAAEFDLVAMPHHDGPRPERPNLMRITGAPHCAFPQRLAAEAEQWRERIAHLPRPWLFLVVGGATRRRPFPVGLARRLAVEAKAAAHDLGGSLLVTTSRRTGTEQEQALIAELPPTALVHSWNQGGDNPYMGFLGLADGVIVTGDSVSMVCEACATPGPVWIFSPRGFADAKHERLHDELYSRKLARPLGTDVRPWRHPPLNAAWDVAAEIRKRLNLDAEQA